ncbi:CT20-domain-containing protein [Microthyrium microscopicum]|uniref:CT20-domain-containing protein n=1 Tax=Microthyrium microscopicum TaxID=703497 RepID=A0A6A6TTY1_9PEZI|nr:CT20-domain-containing protein [Microthyrium microscopicum]
MPPRKRARHSTRNSSTPLQETQPKVPPPQPAIPQKLSIYADAIANAQNDPWTDEEVTLLFKGLVRWKPTGIHKHFRMLSIFEHFRSHGFASGLSEPPAHLRIPGIWAKLYSLYDLDALDQRENAHAGIESAEGSDDGEDKEDGGEDGDEGEQEEWQRDFELPDLEVDPESIWKRRLASGKDELFEGPELVKGLSTMMSIPGVKLSGENDEEEAEDDEEEGEDEDEEEGDDNDEEEDEEESDEEEESEESEKAPPKRGGRKATTKATPKAKQSTKRRPTRKR